MNGPIPLEDAWERLLALIAPLPSQSVPVDDSNGRILAEDLVARRTQPAHDLSAMDGFAIAGTGPWRIVGESRAGAPFAEAISDGKAIRISTGAHMPGGADSVLIIENADVDGELVSATSPPQVGRHIRRAGFDFRSGDSLLEAGLAITPARIALARMAGHSTLSVAKRPTVAIIECGDELAADPGACTGDIQPASNGAMMAAMARGAGAIVKRIGPVADRMDALENAFDEARDADLVLTSGGASVGEHDLVKPVLERMSATLAFWKVAIRPGKPLLVAQRGRQLVLGLPGNPVSSFVTAFLFALPVIRALQRHSMPLPQPILLPTIEDLEAGGTRREFMRARFEGGPVVPIHERDSSALRALSLADMLIDRPAGGKATKAGTPVPCYWLENGGIA